jgi:hypothetical protein
MTAGKEDVIRAIRQSQGEIERVALSLSERDLAGGVYEGGWNAKQLLCHLAAGGSFAGMMINFAKVPPQQDTGDTFDLDAANAAEVASREGKSVAELLDELRSNSERSVTAVEAAPDNLLSAHFRAPWGAEGALADVIIEALEDHVGKHLAELRTAAG